MKTTKNKTKKKAKSNDKILLILMPIVTILLAVGSFFVVTAIIGNDTEKKPKDTAGVEIKAYDQLQGGCCAHPYYYDFDEDSLVGYFDTFKTKYTVEGFVTNIDDIERKNVTISASAFYGDDEYVHEDDVSWSSNVENKTIKAHEKVKFKVVFEGNRVDDIKAIHIDYRADH